ncbi:MAG: hypothetical protein Q4A07_11065 [Coriobacteriales bacterium]|nr:hypothetical protein [Coriobacteriales bacterium]
MNSRIRSILSVLLAVMLVLGSLSLTACGGGGGDEQDNCYGEDMPVINE